MNFDIICPNCGAASSIVVGVCPYCKTVLSINSEKGDHSLSAVKAAHEAGKTDRSLSLVTALEQEKPELLDNIEFVLLYTRILFEVDGPSSKIKSLLTKALILAPGHPDVLEYLEVIEAESMMTREPNDEGEQRLMRLIRRSPNNVYALFFLGSHLFWVQGNGGAALKYLEPCVRLRPNFIRAKACLAMIYKELNKPDMAKRFFDECAASTSSNRTKSFFKRLTD
ncbi:MAG: hypothetical protein WCI27_03985 [Candidatus Omnitrophota bacterium]